MDSTVKLLSSRIDEICTDYNEASLLYPFWQQYPPQERGRQPVGDQHPWIEVGEHVLIAKLCRYISNEFRTSDPGLPTGPDARFIVRHEQIARLTDGLTDAAWLMIDIKSVGPRDDAPHTVLSHNQVSGSGEWERAESGIKNRVMKAMGPRASHLFHCTLPPFYVLSDGTIALTVLMAIKPVYRMLGLLQGAGMAGQPLDRLDVVMIPNGLLLEEHPGYLKAYPGLIFPGKDDEKKDPLKKRARVSFALLSAIAQWRVKSIPACIDPLVAKAIEALTKTGQRPG